MSAPLWTFAELATATGGQLHHAATGDCTSIVIDSREAQPGSLFIALPSETGGAHGNAFAASAHRSGAALSLVSELMPDAGPQLVVPDTVTALYQIATAARTRSPARRAAVTGSVGKTGTTRAIQAGLAAAGRTHGPVGSFNNHVGVPLTLARMPRDTQNAVFEMGMNHTGEITPLSQLVQPEVALITTIGAVHAEFFPDGERGIAAAKAEIFNGMQPGGIAVLNADNPWFDFLATAARAKNLDVWSFGTHSDATYRVMPGAQSGENGLTVDIQSNGKIEKLALQQQGLHWALNIAGVLAVLDAMDVDPALSRPALAAFAPLAGRGENHRVTLPAGGTYTLIDESYNANPLSMTATITQLGQSAGTGRKIVALTDMLELGTESPAYHRDLAKVIEANGIDLVFAAGPLMQHLWDALPASRRGGYAATAAELLPQLQAALQPGDRLLIKGSKGSKAALLTKSLLDN